MTTSRSARKAADHDRLVERRHALGRLAHAAFFVTILPLLCSEWIRDAFDLGHGPTTDLYFWVPALLGLAALMTVFVMAIRIDAVLARPQTRGPDEGGRLSVR